MKKTKYFFILLFCLFCAELTWAQYTDSFKEFTKTIQPVDSSWMEHTYANKRIKEKGKTYIYDLGPNLYEMSAGKHLFYSRKGVLTAIMYYDKYGFLISGKEVDAEGNAWAEHQTIRIDTRAENVYDFFKKRKMSDVVVWSKFYGLKKDGSYYLFAEGEEINDKKTGIWKIYNPDGSLKEEEIYN